MPMFPNEFDGGEENAIKAIAQASWAARTGQSSSGAPSGHSGVRSRVARQSSAGGRRMTLPDGTELIETADGGAKLYRPSWKERFSDRLAQMRTQSMSDKAGADLNAMPDLQVRRMKPGGTLQQRLYQNRMRLAAIESRKNLTSAVKADLIRIQGEVDNVQFNAWKHKYVQEKLRGVAPSATTAALRSQASSMLGNLPFVGTMRGFAAQARTLAASPAGPVAGAAAAAYLSWKSIQPAQRFQMNIIAAQNPGLYGLLDRGQMRVQDRVVNDVLAGKEAASSYVESAKTNILEAIGSGRVPTNAHTFAAIEARRTLSAGGFNQDAMNELKLMQDRTSMDLSGQGQLMMGWKREPLHGG